VATLRAPGVGGFIRALLASFLGSGVWVSNLSVWWHWEQQWLREGEGRTKYFFFFFFFSFLRAFLTASQPFSLNIRYKTIFYFIIKKYSTTTSLHFSLYH
jgi:hypothetical protein